MSVEIQRVWTPRTKIVDVGLMKFLLCSLCSCSMSLLPPTTCFLTYDLHGTVLTASFFQFPHSAHTHGLPQHSTRFVLDTVSSCHPQVPCPCSMVRRISTVTWSLVTTLPPSTEVRLMLRLMLRLNLKLNLQLELRINLRL